MTMTDYMIKTEPFWKHHNDKDKLIGKLIFGLYSTSWVVNLDNKKHTKYVYGRIKEIHTGYCVSNDIFSSGIFPTLDAIILDDNTYIQIGYGYNTEKLQIEA